MTTRRLNPTEVLDRPVELPAFFAYLGLSLVAVAPEEVVIRMEVPPTLYSAFGNIHGGAVATLIDTALGAVVACNVSEHDRIATHALNINYVSFSKERALLAKARVLRLNRTVATVECDCVTESGTLVAKALGTFGVYRRSAT